MTGVGVYDWCGEWLTGGDYVYIISGQLLSRALRVNRAVLPTPRLRVPSVHPRPRVTKLAAKRNGILNEIFRSRQCLRFDLARRLNINATTTGQYVDALLEEGLLIEGDPAESPRGRAPLQLNPRYGCFLGVDFEALRARCVLCDFAGGVLFQREVFFEHPISPEDILARTTRLARRVARRAPTRLLQVGIAAPGQVDCAAGKVDHYRLIPGFDDIPIGERFASLFDSPVFVEDNIRALSHAELLRGAGEGANNFLCLAIRSGIGLGIVIDGQLYGGTGSWAGEAGYMIVPTAEGPRLATDVVSATGFLRMLRMRLSRKKRTAIQEQLWQQGESPALADVVASAENDRWLAQQLQQLGQQIGTLAANLINVLAPQRLILTGEVPACSPRVRTTLEETVNRFVLPQIRRSLDVVDGRLGGYAAALGAAWLGLARTFPDDEALLAAQVAEAG